MQQPSARSCAVLGLALTAFLAAPPSLASAEEGERDYRFSDTHQHLVNFFQGTQGTDALLEAMDEAKVDHSMLSGIPLRKKWAETAPEEPRFYLGDDAPVYWYGMTDVILAEAYQGLDDEAKARIHPFLSGFNPTDMNAVDDIELLIKLYPGVWQGIGEVMLRHDALTALLEGEVPRANHRSMHEVYALAAEYDLPVLLHSNITSQRERAPIFVGELEEALEAHPATRFLWAHAGTSAEIHRYQGKLEFLHEEVERLLERFDNLYIDLSWTVADPYLIDEDGEADADWVDLVERFPDRFMIGSDLVGTFGSLEEKMREFVPFLDALSEETAEAVALTNFLDVLPDEPVEPLPRGE